jgi:hypothetical protein
MRITRVFNVNYSKRTALNPVYGGNAYPNHWRNFPYASLHLGCQ